MSAKPVTGHSGRDPHYNDVAACCSACHTETDREDSHGRQRRDLVVFLILMLQPMIQKKALEFARLRLLRRIEVKRKSRVITLIHRRCRWRSSGFR